jgi:hypothetical protein
MPMVVVVVVVTHCLGLRWQHRGMLRVGRQCALEVGKQVLEGVWWRICENKLIALGLIVRLIQRCIVVVFNFGNDWCANLQASKLSIKCVCQTESKRYYQPYLTIGQCFPIDAFEETVTFDIFDAVLEITQASCSVYRPQMAVHILISTNQRTEREREREREQSGCHLPCFSKFLIKSRLAESKCVGSFKRPNRIFS